MSFIDNVLPSPVQSDSGESVQADPSRGSRCAHLQDDGGTAWGRLFVPARVFGHAFPGHRPGEWRRPGTTERLGQLFAINGRERDPVQKIVAGDLGALVKLKNSHTNNTLRPKGSRVVIEPIAFPEPRYRTAISAENEGEEDRLAQGIHQLREEDPSLVVVHDPHLRQMTLGGQGEMHLQVARFRLENRFGVGILFSKPRVAYRETITKQARSSYRHKKQTGGAGQFADISIMVDPLQGDFNPPSDISVRGQFRGHNGLGIEKFTL